MLSIIIPTYNAQATLPATFQSLMSALVDGMIKEVIVTDGGSTDKTAQMAEEAGATLIKARKKGRGPQLAEAAKIAKSNWLLFLHADTHLEQGWHLEVEDFIESTGQTSPLPKPAAFTFALKEKGIWPSLLTKLVKIRTATFGMPYGDQGLLIAKTTYEKAGGFKQLPIMEDVDLLRRLTPRPVQLKSRAYTSAVRYQQEGYVKRIARNQLCLAAFYRGVPIEKIEAWYEPAYDQNHDPKK